MARDSHAPARGLALFVAVLAFVSLAGAAHAEDAVPLPTNPDWMSTELTNGACLVWGDLDGDGRLDMVPGADPSGANLLIYLNNGVDAQGRLRFTVQKQELVGGPVSSCALGDLNRDGRLDVVVGRATGPRKS